MILGKTIPFRCASGCVVECRICNLEVAGGLGYFAPRSTQAFIRPGSVNEYQLLPVIAGKAKAGMANSDCR